MWNLDVFCNLVLYTILQKGYIVLVFQKFSFCDSHWKAGGSQEDQMFLLAEPQKLAWGICLMCNQSEASGRNLACIASIFRETRTGGQSSRVLCSGFYPDRVLTRQSPGSLSVLMHSVSLAFFSKHVTPIPSADSESYLLSIRSVSDPQFLNMAYVIWQVL